jgi:hypothetical protein
VKWAGLLFGIIMVVNAALQLASVIGHQIM